MEGKDESERGNGSVWNRQWGRDEGRKWVMEDRGNTYGRKDGKVNRKEKGKGRRG